METLLVYKGESSVKFWKIFVLDNTYTVSFGIAGKAKAVQTRVFESHHYCKKEAEKLVKIKMKKGYTPLRFNGLMVKASPITEESFWELINTAKKMGKEVMDQVRWIVLQLSKKPIKEIVKFDSILNGYLKKSYTADIWAAATIIMGGCNEDRFEYFRAWLLYLGREIYQDAIKNPETLIPFLREIKNDIPQLEELTFAASWAYEEKTGLDDGSYYDLYEHLAGNMANQNLLQMVWNMEESVLSKKFPRLWKLYGENPLEY